jgi:hypothetical protein
MDRSKQDKVTRLFRERLEDEPLGRKFKPPMFSGRRWKR